MVAHKWGTTLFFSKVRVTFGSSSRLMRCIMISQTHHGKEQNCDAGYVGNGAKWTNGSDQEELRVDESGDTNGAQE